MFGAISIADIGQYQNQPNVILVDFRDKEDYDKFHLEGAIHIDYEIIEENSYCLPKDYIYILYCERGGVSLQAARILSRAGYNVKTVIGGMYAHEQEQELKKYRGV